MDRLKPIYKFLFMDHEIGFFRFCMIMLIPCALSINICRWFMVFLVFCQTLAITGTRKRWDVISEFSVGGGEN